MTKKILLTNLILEDFNPSNPGLFKSRGEYIDVPSKTHIKSSPYDPETRKISSEIIRTPFVPVVTLIDHLVNYIKAALKNVSSQTSPEDLHYIPPSYQNELKLIINELEGFKEYIKDRYDRQFEFSVSNYQRRVFIPSSVYKDKSGNTLYRPMVPIHRVLQDLISEIQSILLYAKKYRTKPSDVDFISPDEIDDLKKVVREFKVFEKEINRKFSEQLELPTFQSIPPSPSRSEQ